MTFKGVSVRAHFDRAAPPPTRMTANMAPANRQGEKPWATLANIVRARSEGVTFHTIDISKNS